MKDIRAQAEFQALAISHIDSVARFARWLTKDDVEAEDLVQDTYLRALRAWQSFRAESDCKAWLITICRNTHYSHLRREGRVEAVDAPELEALAAVNTHERAQAGGLDGVFDQFDLTDAVRRELRELPESFREAVVLVDLQDMAYDEAAKVLQVPIGTVRSRLFRGRRLLQEGLLVHARDAGYAAALASVHSHGDAGMMPMGDCHAVLSQLWDYLDGELTADRREEIAAHLRMCGRCFPTFQFEEAFLRAVKSGGDDPSPAGGLRGRVMAALRAQGMPDHPLQDHS